MSESNNSGAQGPAVPMPPMGNIPQFAPPKKSRSTLFILLAIVLPILFVVGLCFVGLLAAIAIPNFLEAQIRSRVSRVRSDLRSMAVAIESYYVDQSRYPANALDGSYSGRHAFSVLTTPIAYIVMPFHDVFQAEGTYRYYSDGPGWIIWSPGPDYGFDLDPTIYRSDVVQPSPELLLHTYDPTNGTTSDGDIWRVKE